MKARQRFLLQMVVLVVGVWALVWGVRQWAESKRVTAERLGEVIAAADLEDWSSYDEGPDAGRARQRAEKLEEVAKLVNQLDFQERQRSRLERAPEKFFARLSGEEKRRFIDRTVRESMGKFMEALDSLPAAERRKFVEQGLREIESGQTEEEMLRARELGKDLLETVSAEGMKAYFEKASTDTKLDLAPLMEAMNEVMQGLRGQEMGLPAQ